MRGYWVDREKDKERKRYWDIEKANGSIHVSSLCHEYKVTQII